MIEYKSTNLSLNYREGPNPSHSYNAAEDKLQKGGGDTIITTDITSEL